MAELFFPGESVDPIEGRLEKGFALYVREVSDLRRLLGLAVDVHQSVDIGFRTRADVGGAIVEEPGRTCLRILVGRLLASPRLYDAKDIDPREATIVRELFDRFVERRVGIPEPNDSNSPNLFEALILSLAAHCILWEAEIQGSKKLSPGADRVCGAFVLLLADPLAPSGVEATLALRAPVGALVTEPGSLIAGLTVAATLKAGSWVTALIGHIVDVGWRSATPAASKLVTRARERGAASAQFPVPRLDELSGADLQRLRAASVVVVLVHGLFSTDVETFDGFLSTMVQQGPQGLLAALSGEDGALSPSLPEAACLRRLLGSILKHQPAQTLLEAPGSIEALYQDFGIAFVGYPHSTLATIESNAEDLVRWLKQKLRDSSAAKLVFVCHSRGGLVARHALALLADDKAWGVRPSELITFGTPHNGAAIAESATGREAAVYLLGMAATHDAVSLLDVCAYLQQYRPQGVEDLRPGGHEAAYLHRLIALERNASPKYRSLLVGGSQAPTENWTWRKRAAYSFLCWRSGQAEHDLVVELSSSLSESVWPSTLATVSADHFSYFDVSQHTRLSLQLAAARVFCQVDWPTFKTPTIPAQSSIIEEDDGIWIDGVFLRRND